MKTTIIAGAIAACLISPALANDPSVQNPTTSAARAAASADATTTSSQAMHTYRIVTRTSFDNVQDTTRGTANVALNRNTDPAAIEATIAANPGLSEQLSAQGILPSSISAISVDPQYKVLIILKS